MTIKQRIYDEIRARLIADLDQYVKEADEAEDDNILDEPAKRLEDFYLFQAHAHNLIKAQPIPKLVREFGIGTVRDDIPEAWQEVIGNRKTVAVTCCEFGMAEEVICLIEFDNGEYEVGIGEALRPYEQLYLGMAGDVAARHFIEAILKAST